VVTPNNQSAPDGYATADTVTFGGTTSADRIYQDSATNSVNGTPVTGSIWLKAPSTRTIQIFIERPGPADTEFTTVTVTTEWQRFSFTHSSTWTGSGSLRLRLASASVAGDYYFWGAQLSNSASVDPYVYNPAAAPTSTAYYGPRFDYNPVTLAANGLLVEEQRSNLLTYSEQLNVAPSAKTNVTVADNAAVSPSGATTASKISATAVSNIHVLQLTQATSALTYTFSVYVKAAEYSWCQIAIFDGTNNFTAFVNLATGALGTTSGSATFGVTSSGNGWWRVSITAALLASATSYCQIWVATANNTVSFLGDGTSGILAYGAQLEAGSFATSLIPTQASQVTRAADNASMLGDNFATWYNQTQGTLYVQGGGSNAAGSARLVGVSDGTFSNRMSANKLAVAYALNNVNAAANGTLGTLDTSATIPTVTLLRIGADEAGTGAYLNGAVRSISYYPTRLADTTLTSITA